MAPHPPWAFLVPQTVWLWGSDTANAVAATRQVSSGQWHKTASSLGQALVLLTQSVGWPQITSVSVCRQGVWLQIYCGQKVWVNLKAGKDVKHVGRWCVNYFYPRQGKALFWSILGCRRKSWLLTATKADTIWNLNHFFFSIHQPCKCRCRTKMPQGCRGTKKSKWRFRRAGGCGRSWYVGRKKYSVR